MNSYLIDNLLDANTEINGKWYISKPIAFLSIPYLIKQTIDLWSGKGFLIHFKEDEPDDVEE